MKSLYAIVLVALSVTFVYGQTNTQKSKIPFNDTKEVKQSVNLQTPDRYLGAMPVEDLGRGAPKIPYWVSYPDAIEEQYQMGVTVSTPLWPDSTVYVTIDGGGGFYWWMHGFSQVFDPASGFLGQLAEAEDWFTSKHIFEVDSARFWFWYDRRNSNTAYKDTIRVYITKHSDLFFAQWTDWPMGSGNDPKIAMHNYDYMKNMPSGGTVTSYDFILGENDTATASPTSRSIDLSGTTLGLGKRIGIAFQFIPGVPYSFGDTLLEQSNPPVPLTNPLNVFWLATYEEQPDGDMLAYLDDDTYNADGLASSTVRYNLSPPPPNGGGWNGFYITTLAYGATFSSEHAYVDWKVTPVGANFTHVKNNGIPLTVDFSDFSNSLPDSWIWTFPGGDQLSGENVTYTFATPGTHTVKLDAYTGSVKYTAEKDVTVLQSGIGDIVSNFELSIGPNPTKDMLNVDFRMFDRQDLNVSITNVLGQVIIADSKSDISQYKMTFDLSDMPDGIYLVKFENADFSFSEKVLLSK